MQAGDVVEVAFGMPVGREPGVVRPAVVVLPTSSCKLNRERSTSSPIISNVARSLPTEIVVSASGLDHPSAAQCHLCTVVSTNRVGAGNHDGGNVGAASLAEVRSVLGDLLDIP